MLDINLFRVEKGNDPEIVRESQRRRFASVEVVDEVIHLDKEWRQRKAFLVSYLSKSFILFCFSLFCFFETGQFELDGLRKEFNKINKGVAQLKIVSLILWKSIFF